MVEKRPKVVLILPEKLPFPPEAEASMREAMQDFVAYLNSPKAREVEEQYRKGKLSDSPLRFDWYVPQDK